MKEELFDVVAVDLRTSAVRILDSGKTLASAEAIVKMAITLRGLDEEFYTEVPVNTYKEGDKWKSAH